MRAGSIVFVVAVVLMTMARLAFADPAPRSNLLAVEFPQVLQTRTIDGNAAAGYSVGGMHIVWDSGVFETSGLSWLRPSLAVQSPSLQGPLTVFVLSAEPDWDNKIIHSETLSGNGPVDFNPALPQIKSSRFKLAIGADKSTAYETLQVSLFRALAMKSALAGDAPSVRLENQNGTLSPVADPALMRRYASGARRESTPQGASWDVVSQDARPAIPDYLLADANSVARLERKLPLCYWNQLTDPQNRREADQSTPGCTAFRVGFDLFATAWHCLPDAGRGGCDNAKIQFGYEPKGTPDALGVPEFKAEERCTKIVYRNSRIDFAIFKVSQTFISYWGHAPILEFLTGKNNFPSAAEPLAILHYPKAQNCNEKAEKITGDFQNGLRISRYLKGIKGQGCQLVAEAGRSRSAARFELDPPRDPASVCEQEPRPNFDLGIGYRCATCDGTSGAPVISLSDDPGRKGRVIAVHLAGANENLGAPNRGLRAVAIAECLDLSTLRKDGSVTAAPASPGQKIKDYCKCRLGSDVCPPPN